MATHSARGRVVLGGALGAPPGRSPISRSPADGRDDRGPDRSNAEGAHAAAITEAPDLYQGLGLLVAASLVEGGAHGAIRTRDTRFRRAVLYPLSYVGGMC